MKPLVLAAAFVAATNGGSLDRGSSNGGSPNGGSLGVGLDVLPVAYTFAANRVDFFPDLRLKTCDRTSCRWATGHGSDLVAYVSEWDLAVKRLEIDSANPARAREDKLWFQRACLTVVSLTLAGVDRSEVQSIADTISSGTGTPPSDRREREADGIRFYGTSTPFALDDGAQQTCGAMAARE